MSPVFARDPSWNVIFVSVHMGYSATAPPPTVTVELPRAAPKPLPQIVTKAPRFFCPPVFGPLSRSEKKMLGELEGKGLADEAWARRPNGTARIVPIKNKDVNLMKGYLNTKRAERDRDADGTYPKRFHCRLTIRIFFRLIAVRTASIRASGPSSPFTEASTSVFKSAHRPLVMAMIGALGSCSLNSSVISATLSFDIEWQITTASNFFF